MRFLPRVCLVLSLVWSLFCVAQDPANGQKPPEDIRQLMAQLAKEASWHDPLDDVKLDQQLLAEAIEKARLYYLAQQLPEGNFEYARDVVTGKTATDDNQVRQAGALWGLASLNRDRPTLQTAQAVIRGIQFFIGNSKPLRSGLMAPVYPGTGEIKTGTVALATLAMVELWRGEQRYLTQMGRGLCAGWTTQYINYLGSMEMDDGSWGRLYYVETDERIPQASAYYDGEALLAYCRVARYMGRDELVPKIEKVAPLLAKKYVIDALRMDPKSELTKGFFQWGCMAFAEYVEAGWKDADLMADACLALAWWELRTRGVESKEANTGYAVEGLLAAYKVAKMRGNQEAMSAFRKAIEGMLVEQIAMQVGGPLAQYNHFLLTNRSRPEAVGGIMSTADSGKIRIDIVQHQVHAMLMAMEILYK